MIGSKVMEMMEMIVPLITRTTPIRARQCRPDGLWHVPRRRKCHTSW